MPMLFHESPSYLLTSESVTEGHPDKLCDQISDGVLDAVLKDDPMGRVACETAITNGLVVVMGEITTSSYVDVPTIVRDTLARAGYTDSEYGIDAKSCGVMVAIQEQSQDISKGVTTALEQRGDAAEEAMLQTGAGDQGMMVGFACNETPELLPLTVSLSQRLVEQLALVRKEGIVPYLRPDGKSQVTVEYKFGVAARVDTVVISAQHDPDATNEQIEKDVIEHVINKIVPADLIDDNTKILVNPSGRFVIGGPAGARYVAKNLVAAGLADRAEVLVSYAIGVATPISVAVETFDTNKVDSEKIHELVAKHFDLRPAAIIRDLDLRRPIYQPTAAYGHFGRDGLNLTWEKTDKADALRADAGL
jgi:S-adenosylmethionine synthetase